MGQGIAYYLSENISKSSVMFDVEVKSIASMVAGNDHSGAYLKGAELMNKINKGKYKKLVEIFKHLEAIQDLEKHMPSDLGKYQNATLKDMLSYAKNDLDSVQYDKFYKAF
jgi:hypothetical protein